MAKMRVHELAKEIDMASKDLVALLAENGIEGKTASSSLDDDQIALVKKKAGKGTAAKAEKKATEKKEAEKESEKKEPAKKAAVKKDLIVFDQFRDIW